MKISFPNMSTESSKQRVALVTGASRGIGRAILARLAKSGSTVHGTATSDKGVAMVSRTLESLGNDGKAHLYRAEAVAAADELAESVGKIDILVCNAGMTSDGLAIRMKDAQWDKVIEVNLTAPFRLVRTVSRGMLQRRYGRIIMVSSVVAGAGNAGQANYCASKSGIEGLVRSLAHEFASRNVTVNAVAPGLIKTDMTREVLTNKGSSEQLLSQIPLCRAGSPAEVAAVVNFAASEEASYVTGSTLSVNGGMVMG